MAVDAGSELMDIQVGTRVTLHGKPGTIIDIYESNSWSHLGRQMESCVRVQLDEVPGRDGVYACPIRDIVRARNS